LGRGDQGFNQGVPLFVSTLAVEVGVEHGASFNLKYILQQEGHKEHSIQKFCE
jgi:hypothetical protein